MTLTVLCFELTLAWTDRHPMHPDSRARDRVSSLAWARDSYSIPIVNREFASMTEPGIRLTDG